MSVAFSELGALTVKRPWASAPLREICEFHNGLWKGKKEPFETAAVIRNTNFTVDGRIDLSDVAILEVEARQLAKRCLQKNDIIIEKSGGGPKQPVGRVVLFDLDTDGKYSFSNFTSAIRVVNPNEVDPIFLHRVLYWWYTSGRTEAIQSHSTGIRNLDFNAYKDFVVPIPPLDEQKRIVAVLDQAFTALGRARAHAEANLADARELFDSTRRELLSATDGGIATSLGDEIELLVGFAFKSSGYVEAGDSVRLLRGDNIIQGSIRWDDAKHWPANAAVDYGRFLLRAGDVVLAMDRPWVKAGLKRALLLAEDVPALLVQRTACLRAGPRLDNRYLFQLISADEFSRHLLGVQTGIGVPHISGQQIKDFTFTMPPLAEQHCIVSRLDALHRETKRLESHYTRKLADLDELKQSLLQKAFSGNLI